MKELKTGIRYVKVGHPDIVQYFSQRSINLYDPERAGWVRDDGSEFAEPEDVINFMNSKTTDITQPEVRDVSTISVRELGNMMDDLTMEELEILAEDKRVTARRLAKEELLKR